MPVELDIESLAYGGDAIAHMPDGRVAFVRGGCPGDRVEVEIVAEHPRRVEAAVTRVVTASPDRVEPPCPYFGTCGGCQWQHVAYSAQLTAKRQAVVDALTRIGGVTNKSLIAETVPSPKEYGYRNKIEMVVGDSDRGLSLGFTAAGSHDLVPVDSCLLLPSRMRKAPKALRGTLRYASGSEDLGLKRVALRVAANSHDVEVALWTRPGPFPRSLVARALGDSLKPTSIVRVLVKEEKGPRAISNVEVLKGKGAWRERIDGRGMLVSAPSFFQVNTGAAEELVSRAVNALDPDGTDRVLDLYAGVGTFTLPIAERAGETVAIESSRHALGDLRRNAEAAEVWVDIVPGDASRELKAAGAFTRVLVDPPRVGLSDEAVHGLIATRAERIVYVSCDPATLARDVKRLAEGGYELSSATPVDLFPQTYHVETIAVLERTT